MLIGNIRYLKFYLYRLSFGSEAISTTLRGNSKDEVIWTVESTGVVLGLHEVFSSFHYFSIDTKMT